MSEAATFGNIVVETGPVTTITINTPPANTLSAKTLSELSAAFDSIESDDAIRAVIITGAGQYVFIGGADINEFIELAKDGAAALAAMKRGADLFTRIETFCKPVIAAINGVCAGGGCELAMACDIRIMAETAKIGQPEIKLGIIPGWGGTQRLPQLVGRGRALMMMFSGDMISAAEAAAYGLINEAVPDNQVLSKAKNVAKMLAAQAPLALAAIKRAVKTGLDEGLERGIEAERSAMSALFGSADTHEGVTAFLEKRRPKFTGK
ncbi:MAG: enoyl-CoA hydratase-related protein [Candidatus Eremiobacteraeota bacterium]|nr:enoyl-CoA hydratase-related protein [Candidatus Eremiobacteraeota bacterium]